MMNRNNINEVLDSLYKFDSNCSEYKSKIKNIVDEASISENKYKIEVNNYNFNLSATKEKISETKQNLNYAENEYQNFPTKKKKIVKQINDLENKYINKIKSIQTNIYKKEKPNFFERKVLKNYIPSKQTETSTNFITSMAQKHINEIVKTRESEVHYNYEKYKTELNSHELKMKYYEKELNNTEQNLEIGNKSDLNKYNRLKEEYSNYIFSFYSKIQKYLPDNNTEYNAENYYQNFFDDIFLGYSNLSIYKQEKIKISNYFTLKPYNFKTSDINNLLITILNTILYFPQNYLNIIPVDINGNGENLKFLRDLLKLEKLFPYKCITDSKKFSAVVTEINNRLNDLILNLKIDKLPDLINYNKTNSQDIIPVTIILFFGSVDKISDRSTIEIVNSIFNTGPKRGIYPIFQQQIKEENSYIDSLHKEIIDSINTQDSYSSQINSHQINTESFALSNTNISFNDINYSIDNIIQKIMRKYSIKIDEKKFETNNFEYENHLWDKKSIDGVYLNVGKDIKTNHEIEIPLGVSSLNHMLVAGMSGTGKTNILHVMLNSIMHNYSPAEVQIVLMDLKEGTDFNCYAFKENPYAQAVALGESSLDYCAIVLNKITKIMSNRGEYFRKINAQDYHTARKNKPNQILPRILIIIDEFQSLLKDDKYRNKNVDILTNLCKKGRSFGIHIILSTQTLKGLSEFNGLLTQVPCRIAFNCNNEESGIILGNLNNYGAANVKKQGQCIINYENGTIEKNIICNVPLASNKEKNIEYICKKAQKLQKEHITRIYASNILPSFEEIKQTEFDESKLNIFLGNTFNYNQSINKINLSDDPFGNILVDGYHKEKQNKIIISILKSLKNTNFIQKIYYFDPYDKSTKSVDNYSKINDNIKLVNNLNEIDYTQKSLIIINNIDGILNKNIASNSSKSTILSLKGSLNNKDYNFTSNSNSSSIFYEQIAKRTSEENKNIFVMGFTNDYSKINRDYISLFNIRIELLIEKNRLIDYFSNLVSNKDDLYLCDNNIGYIGNILQNTINGCILFEGQNMEEETYDI